jgi:2-oxoglutarate ferredoxin oxidoreductase subunit alpha
MADRTAAVSRETAETTIVVECNATGQFADVIEHDTLTRVRRVNKYDGVRFKADELAAEIEVALAGDGSGGQEVRA